MVHIALLSLGYLAAALTAHLLALGCGMALLGVPGAGRLTLRALALGRCHALGIVWLSATAAALGLAGWLRTIPVAIAWIAPALIGWMRMGAGWAELWRDLINELNRAWTEFTLSERAVTVLTGAWGALMSANALAGSLAPDLTHDAMWYHLALAGQWALRGGVPMFSHQLHSVLTLPVETIYAGILLYADEIVCTCFYAQATLILLWTLPVVAAAACAAAMQAGMPLLRNAPRATAARAALWCAASVVGLLAANIAIAPVSTKNDNIAALLMLHGALLIFPSLIAQQTAAAPARRSWLAGGILLGAAVCAKLVTAAFLAPFALAAMAQSVMRNGLRPAARMAAWLAAGAALAWLPWLARGFMFSGNPIYPLAADWFPLNPEYMPALKTARACITFYAGSMDGLHALLTDVPVKIGIMMTDNDGLFLLLLVAASVCLGARDAQWQWYGASLFMLYPVFFALSGYNNVARFFRMSYPLAAPAFGLLFGMINARYARDRRLGLGAAACAVILAATAYTYASRQIRWGASSTIQWPYHPILDEAGKRRYAANMETGFHYLALSDMRPLIPQDANVLLADCRYPYYLKRRCFWNDEVCGNILDSWQQGLSPAAMGRDLARLGITHAAALDQTGHDKRLTGLESAGILSPIANGNGQTTWRLWKVNSPGDSITQEDGK